MQLEIEVLGFHPYGNVTQERFGRRVMDLEQEVLENPEINLEIKYTELAGHPIAQFS